MTEYHGRDGICGPLHVRRTGTGARRIVCLHPLASSGRFWDPMAEALGGSATGWSTLLAPDSRGHGRSVWDGAGFAVDDMADDVAAVIRATGTGSAGIVGMSMGGCVALSIAIRYPDLVDRLVLCDTTSCYGPDRKEKWEARARYARATPREDQVAFQVDRWFSERFRAARPAEVSRVVELFLETDSEAHAAACKALGAFDVTERLPEVKAPTLIVVGEHDTATPVDMANTLAYGISNSELAILPGASHLSLLEHRQVWPRLASHLRLA